MRPIPKRAITSAALAAPRRPIHSTIARSRSVTITTLRCVARRPCPQAKHRVGMALEGGAYLAAANRHPRRARSSMAQCGDGSGQPRGTARGDRARDEEAFDHAEDLVAGARLLADRFAHVGYHLALLFLEEVATRFAVLSCKPWPMTRTAGGAVRRAAEAAVRSSSGRCGGRRSVASSSPASRSSDARSRPRSRGRGTTASAPRTRGTTTTQSNPSGRGQDCHRAGHEPPGPGSSTRLGAARRRAGRRSCVVHRRHRRRREAPSDRGQRLDAQTHRTRKHRALDPLATRRVRASRGRGPPTR